MCRVFRREVYEAIAHERVGSICGVLGGNTCRHVSLGYSAMEEHCARLTSTFDSCFSMMRSNRDDYCD